MNAASVATHTAVKEPSLGMSMEQFDCLMQTRG